MKNAIILGTLLVCAISVHADVKPEPIQASHIFKLTPPAIKKLMPKGAKILETTSFPIGPKGSDVLVHLYADSQDAFADSGHLELYTKSKTGFHRIQLLSFRRPNPEDTIMGVTKLVDFSLSQPYWLNVRTKQPIISLFIPNYRGETAGKFVLFTFSRGVAQPPTRQDFDYFTGDFGRRSIEIESLDKAGNVRLIDRFQDGNYQPDYNRSTEQILVWNGSKFIPEK